MISNKKVIHKDISHRWEDKADKAIRQLEEILDNVKRNPRFNPQRNTGVAYV